jgi:CDP-diacylglycerol--glycerol-3-phosphate 3-phosphatidyltransferase
MRALVPNILTIARVAAAPGVLLVFAVLPRPGADLAAFLLFTIASATDWIDGRLARAWGATSPVGRMLDPIADKALALIALAALLGLHGLDPRLTVPAAAILLRETLVSGLREYLKGAEVLSVTALAKWKTTAQLAALATLLASGAVEGGALGSALWALGVAALWIAGALTVVTGWDYFSRGIAHIRREAA